MLSPQPQTGAVGLHKLDQQEANDLKLRREQVFLRLQVFPNISIYLKSITHVAWRVVTRIKEPSESRSAIASKKRDRVALSVSAPVTMCGYSSLCRESSCTFLLMTLILWSAFVLITPVQGKPTFYFNSKLSLRLKLWLLNAVKIWHRSDTK